MNLLNLFSNVHGFDWDRGNQSKNWDKHQVKIKEAEQVFFNKPLKISINNKHTKEEQRYGAYGKTINQRPLYIVFTIRSNKIRIISARDQNKKERKEYAKKT